jgi:hypothetical protein
MTPAETLFSKNFSRFRVRVSCPHCCFSGCFQKDGSSFGRQRFRCQKCRKSVGVRELIDYVQTEMPGSFSDFSQRRFPSPSSHTIPSNSTTPSSSTIPSNSTILSSSTIPSSSTHSSSSTPSSGTPHPQAAPPPHDDGEIAMLRERLSNLEDSIPRMISAALSQHFGPPSRKGNRKRSRVRSPSPALDEASDVSLVASTTISTPPPPSSPTDFGDGETPIPPVHHRAEPSVDPRDDSTVAYDEYLRPLRLSEEYTRATCGSSGRASHSPVASGEEHTDYSSTDEDQVDRQLPPLRSSDPREWDVAFFTGVKWSKIHKVRHGLYRGGINTDKIIRLRWHRKSILEIVLFRDVKEDFTGLVETHLGWSRCKPPSCPSTRRIPSGQPASGILRCPPTPDRATQIRWFFDAMVPKRPGGDTGADAAICQFAFTRIQGLYPDITVEALKEQWDDAVKRYLL